MDFSKKKVHLNSLDKWCGWFWIVGLFYITI